MDYRYRRNTSNSIANIRNGQSNSEASVTAVAVVIAVTVLLVVFIMVGLGSVPLS